MCWGKLVGAEKASREETGDWDRLERDSSRFHDPSRPFPRRTSTGRSRGRSWAATGQRQGSNGNRVPSAVGRPPSTTTTTSPVSTCTPLQT